MCVCVCAGEREILILQTFFCNLTTEVHFFSSKPLLLLLLLFAEKCSGFRLASSKKELQVWLKPWDFKYS